MESLGKNQTSFSPSKRMSSADVSPVSKVSVSPSNSFHSSKSSRASVDMNHNGSVNKSSSGGSMSAADSTRSNARPSPQGPLLLPSRFEFEGLPRQSLDSAMCNYEPTTTQGTVTESPLPPVPPVPVFRHSHSIPNDSSHKVAVRGPLVGAQDNIPLSSASSGSLSLTLPAKYLGCRPCLVTSGLRAMKPLIQEIIESNAKTRPKDVHVDFTPAGITLQTLSTSLELATAPTTFPRHFITYGVQPPKEKTFFCFIYRLPQGQGQCEVHVLDFLKPTQAQKASVAFEQVFASVKTSATSKARAMPAMGMPVRGGPLMLGGSGTEHGCSYESLGSEPVDIDV